MQLRSDYVPAPLDERHGIGLCLSGGGFRATLFHLGGLRRLDELGLIGKLRTVSSVSGGSIAAAHLATVLARLGDPPPERIPDWDRRVRDPLRAFTAGDRRTQAAFSWLLPSNWGKRGAQVETLARVYAEHLTALKLRDVPVRPNFVLCATDMAYGVNWRFERTRMGDYQVGDIVPPPDWPLARAVAASSCFPPVFAPLPVSLDPGLYSGGAVPPGAERDALVRDLRLTDGGDYDNLGLEPVWKDHQTVLVSDGGAPFDVSQDQGFFWRVERYAAILGNQAHALRLRWLVSNFIAGQMSGAYWGTKSATTSYDPAATVGYSKSLASGVIAKIRTDLDAFSDAEAAVLENHGYLLADAAIRRHVPSLMPPDAPPAAVPHPEWLDETTAQAALKDSSKRRLLGRG